jgi:hypothetical protein
VRRLVFSSASAPVWLCVVSLAFSTASGVVRWLVCLANPGRRLTLFHPLDMWAVGVIFADMLAKRPLLHSKSVKELLTKQVHYMWIDPSVWAWAWACA